MIAWPVPPDWSESVTETLEWSTDVLQGSRTGSTQRRALRGAPRRTFSWQSLSAWQDRRLLDLMLADQGAFGWLLPIWPDGQTLSGAGAGNIAIQCETTGYDFVGGGQALVWQSPRYAEVVGIDTVEADSILLTDSLTQSYAPGARLYPLRSAIITADAEEEALSDEIGLRKATATIIDFCAWPAAMPTATIYRSWPVLEWRPNESESPASSNKRLLTIVDNGTAPQTVIDLAERAFRAQAATWSIYGREEHTAFRSMLYSLAGRANPAWVPSFTADLRITQNISAGSNTLQIEWCGYAAYGIGRAGRQDIRIELMDGSSFCRRITKAVAGTTTEILTLDSTIPTQITVSQIRQVSYLRLCALASDTVEVEHVADAGGQANCKLTFEEVVE